MNTALTRRHAFDLLTVAGATIILAFLVYPTAWVLIASFKTPETMFSATRWAWTFENYTRLFAAGFGRNIVNSLVLCGVAVLVSTIVSVNAAYAFSRLRFRGRGWLFGGVLLGQTFPWIILVTPVFILFARAGLLNNWLSMIFIYVAISIPFSIYLPYIRML